MFNQACAVTSASALARNSHTRQRRPAMLITPASDRGSAFSYRSFKLRKSLSGNTLHVHSVHAQKAPGSSRLKPFRRERMLIQGVIYCPASSRFTVSAHSLTHACMLRFTQTPSSSHNKASVMCIRAHEDTSGRNGYS